MGRFDALTQLDKKLDNPPPSEKPVSRSKQQGISSSKLQQSEKEGQPTPLSQSQQEISQSNHDTVVSRNHDTMTPTNQPIHHETSHPLIIPESEEDYIETIRKAVKQVGKEGGTYRFTLEEKSAMKQIKRHYEDLGIDTSDIEITRIGLNYIVLDFHKHGEESILAKVIKRLNE